MKDTVLPEQSLYTEASMDRRTFLGAGAALAATLDLAHPAAATKKAAAAPVRKLPPAQKSGGKPLMDCLSGRRSTHMPGKKELTEQQLANVLWAACGISSESGKRTVPTAMNRQRIAVYAALKDGVWRGKSAQKGAFRLSRLHGRGSLRRHASKRGRSRSRGNRVGLQIP